MATVRHRSLTHEEWHACSLSPLTMSSLPTIDETRADAVASADGVPRRSPPASAGVRSASPWSISSAGGGSAASSPAPTSLQQQQQQRGSAMPQQEKRKREAFEYVSDSEDEDDAPPAARRNVQPRATAAQQHAQRRAQAHSRSPSPSRTGSAASASATQSHVAAASSTAAHPAPSPSPSPSPSFSSSVVVPFLSHDPSLSGCRSVSCYRRLNTIDEGSYGVVHRAEDRATGTQVALKKIKLDAAHGAGSASGFPITALREINNLLALNHPNIIRLREIVTSKSHGGEHSIYMVMQYSEHDLKALMLRMGASQEDKIPTAPSSTASTVVPSTFQPFRVPEIKNLLRQLLSGVAYMHRHWVLHRDLKTSNLLYGHDHLLKICDLGLARRYGDPLGEYTPLVVTLWYRAPELLWGAKKYSTAVDMWSVGCIFAELLLNRPLLTGQSEMEQLSKMVKLLGTPSLTEWPEFSELEHARNFNFTRTTTSKLRELFPTHSYTASGNALSEQGFHLLQSLLCYNPTKRISAAEALQHPYFSEAPLPQSMALMPTFPASNEAARMHDGTHAPNSGDLRRKREQEAQGFFL